MTYLNIKTQTELELRELFTLGLTSKRDGTKIGHKGTGLKFSLAQLHRLGSHLEVHTAKGSWKSDIKTDAVRGETHEFVILRAADGSEVETGICTNAGIDTWTEAWFCLRELLQNVIDEGGHYEVTGERYDVNPDTCKTFMRILLTERLAEAWATKDQWFHPKHPEIIYESACPGLYFHGFKVYEHANWKWSYDVTTLLDRANLSEDRQIRSVNFEELFGNILRAVPDLPDSFYSMVIEAERHLPQDVECLHHAVYRPLTCSQQNIGGFKMAKLIAAFQAKYGDKACWTTNRDRTGQEWYYARCAGYEPVIANNWLCNLFSYQDAILQAYDCLPTIEKRLVAATEMRSDAKDNLKKALRIVAKLRPKDCKVEIVNPQFPEEKLRTGALAIASENKVVVLKSFVENHEVDDIVRMLIHEFTHLESGEGDCTEGFEKALVCKLAELIMPKRRQEALVF